MSKERPVASDRVLSRVMTRARGAGRARTSLLWRSSAPRPPRRSIAVCVAALLAAGSMTAAATAGPLDGLLKNVTNQLGLTNQNAPALPDLTNKKPPIDINVDIGGNKLPDLLNDDAAATQYGGAVACPTGFALITAEVIIGDLAYVCALVLTDPNAEINCPDGFVEVDVDLVPLSLACVRAIDVGTAGAGDD